MALVDRAFICETSVSSATSSSWRVYYPRQEDYVAKFLGHIDWDELSQRSAPPGRPNNESAVLRCRPIAVRLRRT